MSSYPTATHPQPPVGFSAPQTITQNFPAHTPAAYALDAFSTNTPQGAPTIQQPTLASLKAPWAPHCSNAWSQTRRSGASEPRPRCFSAPSSSPLPSTLQRWQPSVSRSSWKMAPGAVVTREASVPKALPCSLWQSAACFSLASTAAGTTAKERCLSFWPLR